ncbi:ABC transporter permease [Bacillus suaedaesalsae]|uniref:ABC transporter permease subunit n=1 Tax=Bacillus suaedaesalsae TaxID=2810349 RepID=A0ABS2DIV1_9BACI|nr:ABC transporter permease subunit [Bacillus suaedaesalsae]MBM6617925.1 ABC transporter permease subunit [Bacillus suaedaesalsae]
MIRYIFRDWKFVLSFTFIVGILLVSFLFEPFYGNVEWELETIYDENGEVIVSTPFTPSQYPPFGTDRAGTPIVAKIIQGAKYTILTGLIIGLLQVIIAFIISLFYFSFPKFLKEFFEGIVESQLYVPATIVAFMSLGFMYSVDSSLEAILRLIQIQLVVLIFIGIPPLVLLLVKDIQKVMQEEYILASKTLGASRFSLFKKHIIPFMFPRLILQYSQRTVEVLMLIIHLGFLSVFLGGSVSVEIFDGVTKEYSTTNEWAGDIGKHFRDLFITPWMIYIPLIFYSITVLSFNMMTNTIQSYITDTYNRQWVRKDSSVSEVKLECNSQQQASTNPFAFLHSR